MTKKLNKKEEAINRMAQIINEWLYADSLLVVDKTELLKNINEDFSKCEKVMTEDDCYTFICGEASDPKFLKLCEMYPNTSEYINSFF